MHLEAIETVNTDSPYSHQLQTGNADYPQDIEVETQWNNDSNDAFFNCFTPEVHDEFLFNAGLETDCDISLVLPLIKPNSQILEVGAGYGRTLSSLSNHCTGCNIDAIEKNIEIFNELHKRYARVNHITLHNQDIFDYLCSNDTKYDAILVLWSTLATFCPKEQSLLVQQLYHHLKQNGCLFIDSFLSAEGPKPLVLSSYYKVRTNGQTHWGYLCPQTELERIVSTYQLGKIDCHRYNANRGVERLMAIITKPASC